MTANWTNGNGSRRVVKINTSNSFTAPGNATDPTANSSYGGSGEQVVYNGSSNSVTVTGLSAGTTYWFRIYEANCTGSSSLYYTVSANGNPISQMSDVKGPVITLLSPNNETVIDNHPTFKMTFNKNVEIGNGYLKVYKKGSIVPTLSVPLNGLMINWNNVVVTYNSAINGLEKNQEYFVLVDAGAFKDYSGNPFAGITSNSIWQFKTGKSYMTGIYDQEQNNIIIYPNPTKGALNISIDKSLEGNSKIDVYNTIGLLIQSKNNSFRNNTTQIDLSGYSPGLYLIKIDINNNTYFGKIIKE